MDGNSNKKYTFSFTTVDGRRLTTLDFDALKQMAALGRITPETLIEVGNKVYVAAKVRGLVFGTPPASSPGQVSGGAPFSLDPSSASSSGQVSGGVPFSLDPSSASSPGQVSGGAPFSLDPPPASSPGQVSGGAPFSLDPPPASSPEPQTIVVKHKKKEKEGCVSQLFGFLLLPLIGGAICSEIFGIDQDTATGALFILCLVVNIVAEKYGD